MSSHPSSTVLPIPEDYVAGYALARKQDPVMAERYMRHVLIGDPEADAFTEAMMQDPNAKHEEWIQRALDGVSLQDAPEYVRDFFTGAEVVPSWFDSGQTRAGCRAFHRHSEMFLGAFVGAVLIEGFSTLISKSFSITGRLLDQGVRRLKQNNRQLIEIFLPGGLEPHGDGWRLSVRVRLVHARVRFLLKRSPEWESEAWGVPLSAAHIGMASASFSALLLKRAAMLGVHLSEDERASFMLVWRYTAHLMGVGPELLFANEEEALRLQKIGMACEPPPSLESILLANGLINSAPLVAGIEEPSERRALVRKIYQVSRALIGDELADQLKFPQMRTRGLLRAFRLKNTLHRWIGRIIPSFAHRHAAGQFQRFLDVCLYSSEGVRYRMPEHVHAEKDHPI